MSVFTLRQPASEWDRASGAPGAGSAAEVPCPVCAEAFGLLVAIRDRHRRPLKTIACARCGLLRTDPLPAPSHLSQFHESEYRQDYKGVRRPKLKHVFRSGQLARERLRRLGSYLGQCAKVLDAGCGSGEWLYMLGAAGHSAVGIEVDPAYAAFGRQEYDLAITTGSVFTLNMPAHEFDCITMFHVLEHLPNPVQVLERVRAWLKDSGVLVIEVPNVNSPHQHPAKRFHYAHVIGFTPHSLTYTLRHCGFQILECSLDQYERNIFAVVRTPTGNNAGIPPQYPGQPVATPPINSPAATLSYYLRASTYFRWLARMGQFRTELRATRTNSAPRAILDNMSSGND